MLIGQPYLLRCYPAFDRINVQDWGKKIQARIRELNGYVSPSPTLMILAFVRSRVTNRLGNRGKAKLWEMMAEEKLDLCWHGKRVEKKPRNNQRKAQLRGRTRVALLWKRVGLSARD